MMMIKPILYPVFFIISKVYALITYFRNYLYDKGFFKVNNSSLPVICVGNLSIGGNGKTPLVTYLAKYLTDNNFKPVILSRGYGGNYSGIREVSLLDSSDLVGDEPLMLKGKVNCPVVISRNRHLGSHYINENNLGNIILLDDGFQHRKLKKDLSLICVNVTTPKDISNFKNNKLLPYGILRENINQALNRIDCFIFTFREYFISRIDIDNRIKDLILNLENIIPENIPKFYSYITKYHFKELSTGNSCNLNSRTIIGMSGIANPEGFYLLLKNLNLDILKIYKEKDHFKFPLKYLNKIRSDYPDIPIVCTEKDGIKIKNYNLKNVYSIEIESDIYNKIEFDNFLSNFLNNFHGKKNNVWN